MSSIPTFSPPDLAPLTIHVLNSSSAEDTGIQKSVNLLQEALLGLVTSLNKHFEAIEHALQQQPSSSEPDSDGGNTSRQTRLEGASTSLYDITAEVVQLSEQAEKTLPRLNALEAQSQESLEMIRKLISASEVTEAGVQNNKKEITELENRSSGLEQKVEILIPPLQEDLVNINVALELGGQNNVVVPPPKVEIPWRAPLGERITKLEEDIEILQQKMRAWSMGCENLMIKTRRERIDETDPSNSKSVSFHTSAFADDKEAAARGWKTHDFMECDLGMCLNYLLSAQSSFSTTEEMIRQWEVVHQLIETKIEHTVHTYIDSKLSEALRDPQQKEHALRIIHCLSPDAAYRNILTQLDFKVDKQVFHTLSSRVFEQLDGIAKLATLHGQAISDISNVTPRTPRATAKLSLSDLTTAHPVRSIQHLSTSRETFTQAQLRLPKPPQPPPSGPTRSGPASSPAPPSRLSAHAPSTPRSSVTFAPDTVAPSPLAPATPSIWGRRRGRPVSART